MAASPAIVQVLDDLFADEVRRAAWAAVSEKRWYFGNHSTAGGEANFWKMDLDGDTRIDALWTSAQARCVQLAAAPLTVQRQYANGHTYGLGGRAHVDDQRPGHYTLLFYAMPEWTAAWGGETIFYHSNGEIALAVLPRPNRAVFFDSRVPHLGRAPGREFGGLRATIAFKLGPAGEPREAP